VAGSSAPFKAVVAWQATPAGYTELKYCGLQSERLAQAWAACPGADVRCIPDTDRPRLLDGVRAAAGDCSSKDILIVFVAGHGALTNQDRWRFVVKGTQRQTLDSSGVSIDELLKETENTHALGVVLLIDTCFSGHAVFDAAVWQRFRTQVLGLVAATSPDAASWEHASLEGTAFGSALIECAKQGVGPSGAEQAVTLTQLGDFLGRRVGALSATYTLLTEVHLLVLRAPATTTLWMTPLVPDDPARRRIQFTWADIATYIRRTLAIAVTTAVCAVAVVAGYSRMHQSAVLNGDVAEIRSGMNAFGWFRGPLIRAYSGFSGPPSSADWWLRDAMGEALPRRFHVQSPVLWEAGRSSRWRETGADRVRTLLPTSASIDVESGVVLSELAPETLQELLAHSNPSWGAAALESLALRSTNAFADEAPHATAAGVDWMQAMDGLHPPCPAALDVFLRERKQASPFLAGAADAGAFLAGCPRTLSDLLTPPAPRIDLTTRLAILYSPTWATTDDLARLRHVLMVRVLDTSLNDRLQETLALQYLEPGCDPDVVSAAKAARNDPEELVRWIPSLVRCPNARVSGEQNRLILRIPAVSDDALRLDFDRRRVGFLLWIRAAQAVLTAGDAAEPDARSLAAARLSEAAHDDAVGNVAVWPALDAGLPFDAERSGHETPLRGHEHAFWFACAPHDGRADAVRAADFADWKALAVAVVACRTERLAADVASLNGWTRGFVHAGLGTWDDAVASMNASAPDERAGAAQGLVARPDFAAAADYARTLQNDRFPNPEAAVVPALARWRRRFDDLLLARDGASCREVAAMLGGMRGWSARSTIGLSQPGIESTLLAATLGKATCRDAPAP
jgi:hypothetical protein